MNMQTRTVDRMTYQSEQHNIRSIPIAGKRSSYGVTYVYVTPVRADEPQALSVAM